jgi:tyrosyl-tRNA synthetase
MKKSELDERPLPEQLQLIKRRTEEVIPEKELEKKLRLGRPLRVKLGLDPTAPDLHLGHSVVLQKLRDYQDLGHIAVLIVGDFTSRIGDPSARNSTRPILTQDEIEANMKTYTDQAFKILDPERTEIRYNSEWLDPMTFQDILNLTSHYTVAQMLERDDFEKRYKSGSPITIREFLYPLSQAYDSVAIKADVELGGTDQKFNLLVGRDIQERYGQERQLVQTMSLLEGTDGVEKMSKSLGNYIGIAEPANEMFGKIMSIPDTMNEKYATLLTGLVLAEFRELHPMEQKKSLAREIITQYHNSEAAIAAQEEFERIFSRKEKPQDVPKISIDKSQLSAEGSIWIVELLELAGLVDTRSDARRLIKQGAVKLDDVKIESEDAQVEIESGFLLRAGKRRFAEINIIEN